ncbi:winged helix DNA-binding domain-containing protein, partial [bacterium]|nr:winged helix DNA-binding domain-containing protein [bacterium]
VEVPGRSDSYYATPETLGSLARLAKPKGTALICPFDSFLWQRERAEDLLDFRYRIEIYVPPPKREFGYYVLPILHEGNLVGRVDPKLHRDRKELEIKAIHLEQGFKAGAEFKKALGETLRDLAGFLDADKLSLPKGWRRL